MIVCSLPRLFEDWCACLQVDEKPLVKAEAAADPLEERRASHADASPSSGPAANGVVSRPFPAKMADGDDAAGAGAAAEGANGAEKGSEGAAADDSPAKRERTRQRERDESSDEEGEEEEGRHRRRERSPSGDRDSKDDNGARCFTPDRPCLNM